WLVLTDDATGQTVLRAGKNLPKLSTLRLNQPWDDGIASLLMLSGEGLSLAGNKPGQPFTDRHQAMLSAVADYAVVGIVNAWLFQSMEARLQTLQQAYDAQASAGLGHPVE